MKSTIWIFRRLKCLSILNTFVLFIQFNDFEIQFYVLDDAIYLRIAEIDSIPLEDTPAARFFSRFRAKYNPNYLTWANGKTLILLQDNY